MNVLLVVFIIFAFHLHQHKKELKEEKEFEKYFDEMIK